MSAAAKQVELSKIEQEVELMRVLVVEDEPLIARAIKKKLLGGPYQCVLAGTLADAWQACSKDSFDLMLLDLRLPDGSGMDFLQRLRDGGINIPVMVMTAFADMDNAVEAMRLKAIDYIKKPMDLDELNLRIEKVKQNIDLGQRVEYSRKRAELKKQSVEFMGQHPNFLNVKEHLQTLAGIASCDDESPTVLILGETGTGKDVAARMLHELSERQKRPFVHVDCASLPKDLMEAELFGHEKGSFTSAHSSRIGLIEAAEDGVLFLDEIGELSLALQAKLLAVLERRKVRRVGSSKERPVKAWLVAGTNRSLAEMVKQGEFRADLYYRLNVLSIEMPPLRERGDDVALLAHHFAVQVAKKYRKSPPPIFSETALKVLCGYNWPGNVRELKHVVERLVLLSKGHVIDEKAIQICPLPDHQNNADLGLEDMTLDEIERLMIQKTINKTLGNVSQAAKILGITRMALRYRLDKHEIKFESTWNESFSLKKSVA